MGFNYSGDNGMNLFGNSGDNGFGGSSSSDRNAYGDRGDGGSSGFYNMMGMNSHARHESARAKRAAEEKARRVAAAKAAKYKVDRDAGKFDTKLTMPSYATNPTPHTPRNWNVQPTQSRTVTPIKGSMEYNPTGMVGEGQTALAKALKAGATAPAGGA